jgi:hypothetical protein
MFQPKFRVFILSLLLLVGLGSSAMGQEATPVADSVSVHPPDALVGDASVTEWYARWWQWAISFPIEIQPTSEGQCGFGQSGPVFFLPGYFTAGIEGPVTCVVPAGTSLFVPLDGVECSTVEPPPFFGRDEAELRACAEGWVDDLPGDLSLTVNGQELLTSEPPLVTTPLFTFNFPETNVYGVPAGVAASVASGYNVLLMPLPAGEYELTVSGTGSQGQQMRFVYRVIVEGPQVMEPAATPDAATPDAASPAA